MIHAWNFLLQAAHSARVCAIGSREAVSVVSAPTAWLRVPRCMQADFLPPAFGQAPES